MSEPLHTHAKQVDLLNQSLENRWFESEDILSTQQNVADSLKNNVLHGWEVKLLHRKLNAILHGETHTQLVPRVVLHSQKQIQVQIMRTTSESMDYVD